VDIGGAIVQKQAIGLPTNVSESFLSDTSSNGLVGFAFSTLNTVQPKQQKTFFDNVAADLDEPVLTALLKSGSNSGQYELGTIDKSLFTGTMANISIDTTNGFWQFNSAQFAVGSGNLKTISSAPIAIADTGTTLMLVADEVATAYYSQVSGAQLSNTIGGYIFPCNADLPDISIAVGDNDLATVPSSVLNFEEVGTNTTSGESGT
jgi:Eukaryotic aspartyl protease.